jgi:ketosteroid isomerase-like protein
MTNQSAVEEASERFYAALNLCCNGDPSSMADVWWHDDDVSSGHPMGTWVHGWDSVWLTWLEFSKVLSNATITASGLTIRVFGDFAYTTGSEHVTVTIGGRSLAWTSQVTNIFRRKNSGWRLVHHHSDKAPSFEDAA